ncbi:AMP-binding protein [Solwaraspora sp. WMMD792]|uniref:phenylacetate--CoA ligase family protein n=1 Tax=Solwaraspora sp. WMMD792 TaxID=3016099 RepID=UPI002415A9D8|nr:AMP-binding protein [Solwaraspora sp. WMMD792]MDG4771034.1 AMP-binding protein [Solwaraspora sp. WMMD792]
MIGHRPVRRWWSECETFPRDRLVQQQLTALRRQLSYVYQASTLHRRRMLDIGWHPADLTDLDSLRNLPIIDKADYLDGLREEPPWGTARAADPEAVQRVHFSSGSTGDPVPVLWTGPDLERWADLYARMAYGQGVRDRDVYLCLFSYPWFVGGLGATAGYQRIGATVVPGGSADTHRQIDTIFRYGVTAVGGTPSFLLHLAEVAEQTGRPLRDCPVRRVMVGGEPGGAVPATRALIEQAWGARCFDGYGCLEFQPVAWECEEQAGGHLAEDFVHAEVLHPRTREPVPDGTTGVLVLTHLDKQATPLVRFWTGDLVVRDGTGCGCGRTHARLAGGVLGRADDMLVVRGVNVFPSAVEQVLREHPAGRGQYQIVLDADVTDRHSGYLTGIKVEIEVPDGTATATAELTAALRQALRVRAQVVAVAPGSLPRHTHKARRVVRRGGGTERT